MLQLNYCDKPNHEKLYDKEKLILNELNDFVNNILLPTISIHLILI